MTFLCCDGIKCRMKNHCKRYNLFEKAHKSLRSSFHTFCNKKNNYEWIVLEKTCTNKKYQELYKKRKQKI